MRLPAASSLGVTALSFALLSCTDATAPRHLAPRNARRDISLSVGGLTVNTTFADPRLGTPAGDCFEVAIDTATSGMGSCDARFTVADVPAGLHTVSLLERNAANSFQYVPADVPPATVDIPVGGKGAGVTFDITAIRGVLQFNLSVNRTLPLPETYQACFTGWCMPIDSTTGVVAAVVRPGDGQVKIFNNNGRIVWTGTYHAAVGRLTTLPDVDLQSSQVAVSLVLGSLDLQKMNDCFLLRLDDDEAGSSMICGQPTTLYDMPLGRHILTLQDRDGPYTYDRDVVADTFDLDTRPRKVSFDIGKWRGTVSGTLQVNGQPGDYNVCIMLSLCATPGPTGAFSMILQSSTASGTGAVLDNMGDTTGTFPYTMTGGRTNLGTITVHDVRAPMTVGLTFGGAPLTSADAGALCFEMLVDGFDRGNMCSGPGVRPLTIGRFGPGTYQVSLHDIDANQRQIPILSPIALTQAHGEFLPANFDISALRGRITAGLELNGAAPTEEIDLCLEHDGCFQFGPGGQKGQSRITLFVRPGPGRATVYSGPVALSTFSFIAVAGQTIDVGNVLPASGDTRTGTGVVVTPLNQAAAAGDPTISVQFTDVSAPGTTTVTRFGAPSVPGLSLGTSPIAIELATTATFDGPVSVCVDYSGTTFPSAAGVKLYHGTGTGIWTDVTTSNDPVGRLVCGSVTSFSPFLVAQGTPIDVTPPEITPLVTGTLGQAGWYTSDVSVSWTVRDPESAITQTSGCDAASVTSDVAAATFTCAATSAGGKSSRNVTVSRDGTPPVIAWSGNAGAYTVDQSIAIRCTAADATSGIAQTTCTQNPVVSGSAYDFALGENSASATATDVAGNPARSTTTFTVRVTTASLCALVNRWVSNAGVAHSLCVKLAHGNPAPFRNELAAQTGKTISAANAAVLSRLAGAI